MTLEPNNAKYKKTKKTLRRIYCAIGNPMSSYLYFFGGGLAAYAVIDPYLTEVSTLSYLLIATGVSAALILIIRFFLEPSNGAQILKAIEKDYGRQTSTHVYEHFDKSGGHVKSLNIEQIARRYGEGK